MEDDVLKLLWR